MRAIAVGGGVRVFAATEVDLRLLAGLSLRLEGHWLYSVCPVAGAVAEGLTHKHTQTHTNTHKHTQTHTHTHTHAFTQPLGQTSP